MLTYGISVSGLACWSLADGPPNARCRHASDLLLGNTDNDCEVTVHWQQAYIHMDTVVTMDTSMTAPMQSRIRARV